MARHTLADSLGYYGVPMAGGIGATVAAGPLAGMGTMGALGFGAEKSASIEQRVQEIIRDKGAHNLTPESVRAELEKQDLHEVIDYAQKRALPIAVMDALSLGMVGQLAKWGRATGRPLTATLGGIAASGVAGGAGEAGAQVYSEGQVRDWGDVGIEFVAELMFGGVEVASLYAGMGAERLRQNHEQDMSNLEAQISAVQNSALGKRSPGELVGYVRDVAAQSDLQHVYIDGNALHQSGLEQAFLEAVPEYAGAVREALDTGGALAVRLEDFVTRVAANEELVSGLREQLRLEPEGLSIAELENNAESELRDALNKRQREMAQMAEEELEREAIYQHVHTQLMNSGRFSTEAARQNSMLLTAFFETMGSRLDEKARALYERLGLRIVGAEHAQGQGATLNQAVRAETRAKYEARIDDLFSGSPANLKGAIMIDRSDVLDMLGYGDMPVQLDEGKVVLNQTNHPEMTAEVWKRVPQWLEDPAMVLQSRTHDKRLVFVPEETIGNAPVYVVVEPDHKRLKVHVLVNGYAKDGNPERAMRDIENDLRKGNMQYVHNEKARVLLGRSGLQLPSLPNLNTSRKKILTERNLAGYRKNAPVLEQGAWHGTAEEGRPVLGEGIPTPEQVEFAATAEQYGGEAAYNAAREAGQTELTYRQWVQVRTPAFKAWFGDWENDPDNASKVVNERTGEPLVVYHGTSEQFSDFRYEKLGATTGSTSSVQGFFFSDNPYDSGTYADLAFNVRTLEGAFDEGRKQYFEARDRAKNWVKELFSRTVGVVENHHDLDVILRKLEDFAKGLPFPQDVRVADGRVFFGREVVGRVVKSSSGREYFSPERSGFFSKKFFDGIVGVLVAEELGVPIQRNFLAIRRPKVLDNTRRRIKIGVSAKRSPGTDGTNFKNITDPLLANHWIAYASNQIKSATDNTGAFSADNDSILYQGGMTPVANLTGVEIDAALNADNVIAKARDWFKANLQGKVVHRDGVGDIRITSRSWDKLRHGMKNNILKAQLLPAIPDILANGEYMGRENLHKKRKDNIVAFHFFVGDVIVSGETVPVAVSVGEDINGNFIYNLTDNPQQYYDKKTAQSSPRGKDGAKGGSQGTNAFEQSIENSDLNINILNQNSAAPRGQFSPDTNTIVLFENADLSTLPHELGHFFLESMVGFANELRHIDHLQGGGTLTAGEQGVLRDVDAIMDWFGTDLPTWNRMTLEEKRGFHEQFARGFEQYLLEGKAPSMELQSVFSRMRAWLLRIYRHARQLDVPMDDDIRQVFDRMLANEDAIRMMEQNRSMAAMFADADSAGMTVEEFAAYQEEQRQASDAALDELQARSMRDMQYIRHFKHKRLRELQRASREIRQGVQMEARAEVLSQPLYRAWQMLEAEMQGEADAKPKWSHALDSRRDSLFVALFADNDAIFVASFVNCCHT